MNKFIIICTILGLSQAQLNRKYQFVQSLADKYREKETQPIVEETAFGSCSCDRTLNQCDAYCCCDTDCTEPILAFWKSNYDAYCAKSYAGGKEYKPFQQCIESKHIYNYNQRMGMQVSQTNNGQLCVELDTGSMFSEYSNYIKEITAD